MNEDDERVPTITGRIASTEPEMQDLRHGRIGHVSLHGALGMAMAESLVSADFGKLEQRMVMFDEAPDFPDESSLRRAIYGFEPQRYTGPVPRRYDYENPVPPPNPRADRRKANWVRAMKEKKERRRQMSGRKK